MVRRRRPVSSIERIFKTMSYDIGRIRADFPALALQPYGKPLVYLDNAASAQKPRQVLDRIRQVYESEYANVHRGLHYLANAATEAYEGGREKVRAFLNAPTAEEIIFTKNATESINLLAYTLRKTLAIEEGDEVVLSIMEHHSNIVPWHFHRERRGAKLVWAPIDEDGNFLVEEFEKLLGPRVKMVALTHMSNALGTVVPIKDCIRMAHARGIPVLVDGSQASVHMEVDVIDLDADFYVFTGHKLYGPTGIGVLYGKREHLERMPPYNGGGEMISVVSTEGVTYNDPPHRFEAGTPNIAGHVGLGVATDYLSAIGMDAIEAREAELLAHATEALTAIDGLRILGTAPEKAAVISFLVDGAHAHDLATLLDLEGVAVRSGQHCAHPLLQFYGVPATCRASFAFYNTHDEIERFAEAIRKVRRLLA